MTHKDMIQDIESAKENDISLEEENENAFEIYQLSVPKTSGKIDKGSTEVKVDNIL